MKLDITGKSTIVMKAARTAAAKKPRTVRDAAQNSAKNGGKRPAPAGK